MNVKGDFFQSRYWLPVLIVGLLVSLILSVYFGYLITRNTRADLDNVARIKTLQSAATNAIFLANKIVTGDVAALQPMNTIIADMDQSVNQLLQADSFTRDTLSVQYQQISTLWRGINDNAGIVVQANSAIERLNAVQLQLAFAADQANRLALDGIESLLPTPGLNNQALVIAQQAYLVGQMSDSLAAFIAQASSDPRYFDSLRNSFEIFEQNHSDLVGGSVVGGPNTPAGNTLRTSLIQMSDSLEGLRSSLPSVIQTAERLLLSRDAKQRMLSSFQDFRLALVGAEQAMVTVTANRFPKPYHLLLTLVGLLIAIIGLIIYQRAMTRREIDNEQEQNLKNQDAILRLLDELVDLGDGDLTISATVSEDFTGAIADSINFTIDQLRQLVSKINSTAVAVSRAARNSEQTAQQLAEASDHQTREITGASTAINEMAVTIDQVSANASESALVAGKSVTIANNGAQLVQDTIRGMDTIREQIQDTSKRIKRLGESSQEIGDIVSLINDIADQTNILALNAAIQASMAGDAGRGFAVVADEVQRLAERSAAATKQIETIVKTIQTDTNEAVISMEQTTAEVVNGAHLAQDAGVALGEIENVSVSIADLVQNISNAASQQSASAGQISHTMTVIQQITSQTSTGTVEAAQSIGDLANMAADLRQSVAGFTLPADMVVDPEDHAMSAPGEAIAAPDTPESDFADNTVEAQGFNADKMGELMDELGMTDEDLEQSGDFFELLLGEETPDEAIPDEAVPDEAIPGNAMLDGGVPDGEAGHQQDAVAEKETDDWLAEFDVDLSEIEFPNDRKSVS